ncbi:YHYH domain-containing protein [Pseudomonas sp. PS02303]
MKAIGHTLRCVRGLTSIKMSMEQALMKLSALLIAALLSISSVAAFAHSGGTDSKGCHRNHKTNDYHCH